MVEIVVLPIESSSFFQRSVIGLISFGAPACCTSTTGTSVGMLLRADLTPFAGWDVATYSVGASMGDFCIDFGGVDDVRTSRRTVFGLFLVVEGFPADRFDDLRVLSNDLFSPSL